MDRDGRWERSPREVRLDRVRSRSTLGIVGSLLFPLVFLMPALWLTGTHVHQHVTVTTQGVQETAVVVDRHHYHRGPDQFTLALAADATLTIQVDQWSSSTRIGDRVAIFYDPHNPGRVVVRDTFPVPLHVGSFIVAVVGVIGVVFLSILTPPSLQVLRERSRADRRAQGLTRARTRWATPWVAIRRWTHHAPLRVVLIIGVGGPLGFSGLMGAYLALESSTYASARDQTTVTAEITGSEWAHGSASRLHLVVEGTEVTVDRWEGVPRAGDTVEVVYLGGEPPRAVVPREAFWGAPERVAAALAAPGAVVATTVLAARLSRRPSS